MFPLRHVGMKHALLIATESYADARIPRLMSPVDDASALAALLADPSIGGYDVEVLSDASARDVRLGIGRVLSDADADDTVLIHLSGHGVNAESGFLYCPADADPEWLNATGVAGSYLRWEMNHSSSRRLVVLVDCCFSGAFGDDLVAKALPTSSMRSELDGVGRAIITSSTAVQQSFELDGGTGWSSVFTRAVVDGIETGDADTNRDGIISLQELYNYAYEVVRAQPVPQTPSLTLLGLEGSMQITRTPLSAATRPPVPAELVEALANPYPAIRMAALEEVSRLIGSSLASRSTRAREIVAQLVQDSDSVIARRATELLRSSRVPNRRSTSRSELVGTVSQEVRIPASGFYDAARRLAPFCSADAARPMLGSIHVESDGGSHTFIATDSYRLGVAVVKGGDGHADFNLDCQTLQRMPHPNGLMLTLRIGDALAEVDCDGRPFGVPLVKGDFPSWRSLVSIPEPVGTARVNRADLVSTLEDLARSRRGWDQVVVVELAEGIVRLRLSPDDRKSSKELRAQTSGVLSVGFNHRYLCEAAAACGGATVLLQLTDQRKPVMLTDPADSSFSCLVMPVQMVEDRSPNDV